jgi:hypothetical protein
MVKKPHVLIMSIAEVAEPSTTTTVCFENEKNVLEIELSIGEQEGCRKGS